MKRNTFSLKFNKSNSKSSNYLKNNIAPYYSNQKIISGERNLNDLNLDTETEISQRGSDLSLALDGFKKEIDEISQNIMETEKKVLEYTQKNIENSKRLRQKSLRSLRLPNNTFDEYNYNKTGNNFFSPERYYKYQTPSRINKITNYNALLGNNNNNMNFNNYFNDNINDNINDNDDNNNTDYFDYNNNFNNYNSNNNFNINDNNNDDFININNYYKKNINTPEIYRNKPYQNINNMNNNMNIKKGYIKQSNRTINSYKKNNINSLNSNKEPITEDVLSMPADNEISKLLSEIKNLKSENQKLKNEYNNIKSENNSLTKAKNDYSNKLKAKELLIKELGN